MSFEEDRRANQSPNRLVLSDESERNLIRTMLKELEARAGLNEQHADHHRWIEARILAEDKKAQLYEKITHEVVTKGVFLILGLVGLAVVFGASEAWRALFPG